MPDGTLTSDPKKCADMLNSLFYQQFRTSHQFPMLGYEAKNEVPDVSPSGVAQQIKNLKSGKAPGPDGFGKADLSIDIELTAACLSRIFQVSLQTGQLLLDWKRANVSPLHKSGTTVSVNNYRPIVLTNIPCEILEHIVLRNLLEKTDTKLNNRQHGFRRGLSCEIQTCATMHDILYAINNQKTVHAAVIDFTKAFDQVPHALLLQKLSQIADVDNYLLCWVHNFLTDRKQRATRLQLTSKADLLRCTTGISVTAGTFSSLYK